MISFDNTYARELTGFYAPYAPQAFPSPALLRWNADLAEELGLSLAGVSAEQLARWFSGSELPDGAQPIAQAYAGHQFGNFVPQLGDGRALLLGEVVDRHGRRRDIAFKGSGATPFSRGGDGKAAVGPVLREYVVGEAMHALGIPTTRALAAVATGEPVRRERTLPGAVLTRVAASHIRVGTFQYFAVRGDLEKLRRLADYVIARHYPEIGNDADRYLSLLRAVAGRQASLIAQWMHVGFIHGVMNTDNMAISGETIDYGPCAFMEAYDSATVFSSIDRGGRYAYGRQPAIAQWNLARFAETLLPLIDEGEQDRAVERATEVLQQFAAVFAEAWLAGMRRKLGLTTAADEDRALVDDWLALIQKHGADYTLAWRRLADTVDQDAPSLHEMLADPGELSAWLARWRRRLATESQAPADVAAAMRKVNPLYIPRNQRVEEALAAATDDGDLRPFERLLEAVTRPFEERPGYEIFAEPAAVEFASCFRTFCGT
ncbi:MAG: YdiU family protein [Planctomycetes bacterium]|nr:YdiU family protein [Planctomycetota bacterium]